MMSIAVLTLLTKFMNEIRRCEAHLVGRSPRIARTCSVAVSSMWRVHSLNNWIFINKGIVLHCCCCGGCTHLPSLPSIECMNVCVCHSDNINILMTVKLMHFTLLNILYVLNKSDTIQSNITMWICFNSLVNLLYLYFSFYLGQGGLKFTYFMQMNIQLPFIMHTWYNSQNNSRKRVKGNTVGFLWILGIPSRKMLGDVYTPESITLLLQS